ncbi:Ldh family oxidoreductase [Usitatibacter palustris]|uniref:(2R)-3-sulfolactate dehydrogenase (NADP(+)) n=1 Tax=Usitatibacter palustris TaxID=2732487 RepID=A0A6M4HA05_9PROT|nr:Ldh family oxidoreductase [Usitatibacter palustris]QJR16609.1 (2R)-3-sulfolactate dehydrogenase (NADP(+)) [Usitatibacter palustris]
MTSSIPCNDLERLMVRALEKSGATPAMAAATARALAAAELEGLASHGASRIPQYCSHLKNGRATGTAVPEVVRNGKAACLVDAKQGLAFPACALAVSEVITRAREFGVAFAAVTNSNHFGVAAYHVDPIAQAGLVGLAFGNSPAAMPAWGGRRALFGTNPIAATFPRRDKPALVIDLSLSEVARGKIMVAAREGRAIPNGWALDKDGNPTTDAKAALEGSMLPAGGVKGAMLALTVELMVCALSGAAFGFESDSFFTEEGRPTRIGQAFLAIDPAALAGRDVFLDRVETLVAAMTEDSGVRLPGERRLANRERAARDGVGIAPDLLLKIRTLAGEAGHA